MEDEQQVHWPGCYTVREFSGHFSHFKWLAAAGHRIELVDRQGKRFIFEADRPRSHLGAGKRLAAGKPLSPDLPSKEWKGKE